MRRAVLVALLALVSVTVFADEVFESKITAKETAQLVGNGALSVATLVYRIVVVNGNTVMKIEVSQQAYDLLRVGDLIRVTYAPGLFSNDIKAIKLLQGVPR